MIRIVDQHNVTAQGTHVVENPGGRLHQWTVKALFNCSKTGQKQTPIKPGFSGFFSRKLTSLAGKVAKVFAKINPETSERFSLLKEVYEDAVATKTADSQRVFYGGENMDGRRPPTDPALSNALTGNFPYDERCLALTMHVEANQALWSRGQQH